MGIGGKDRGNHKKEYIYIIHGISNILGRSYGIQAIYGISFGISCGKSWEHIGHIMEECQIETMP